MATWVRAAAAAGLLGVLAGAWAQGPRVYACTDAQGRRLTADRPILECIDREQKVMGVNGVRITVPPTPTAREREAQAEQERRAAEERQKLANARRADRALLGRYPSQAVHDLERAKALQAVEDVVAGLQRYLDELHAQRKKLLEETEFYKGPAQYPPRLQRQLQESEQAIAAQRRALAAQAEEKNRVAARFDEELARLKTLWAPPVTAANP